MLIIICSWRTPHHYIFVGETARVYQYTVAALVRSSLRGTDTLCFVRGIFVNRPFCPNISSFFSSCPTQATLWKKNTEKRRKTLITTWWSSPLQVYISSVEYHILPFPVFPQGGQVYYIFSGHICPLHIDRLCHFPRQNCSKISIWTRNVLLKGRTKRFAQDSLI